MIRENEIQGTSCVMAQGYMRGRNGKLWTDSSGFDSLLKQILARVYVSSDPTECKDLFQNLFKELNGDMQLMEKK